MTSPEATVGGGANRVTHRTGARLDVKGREGYHFRIEHDDLKMIAKEKGGLGQLIIEKRAKIYKLSAKRFFTKALTA